MFSNNGEFTSKKVLAPTLVSGVQKRSSFRVLQPHAIRHKSQFSRWLFKSLRIKQRINTARLFLSDDHCSIERRANIPQWRTEQIINEKKFDRFMKKRSQAILSRKLTSGSARHGSAVHYWLQRCFGCVGMHKCTWNGFGAVHMCIDWLLNDTHFKSTVERFAQFVSLHIQPDCNRASCRESNELPEEWVSVLVWYPFTTQHIALLRKFSIEFMYWLTSAVAPDKSETSDTPQKPNKVAAPAKRNRKRRAYDLAYDLLKSSFVSPEEQEMRWYTLQWFLLFLSFWRFLFSIRFSIQLRLRFKFLQ